MRTWVSPPASPAERGEAFGAAHADAVAANLQRYEELLGVSDPRPLGEEALEAITTHAPAAAAEIVGLAGGAGLEPWAVALLNARTEALARVGAAARMECSTAVLLRGAGAPLTLQTWDWHDVFADGWLVWTIEHEDGTVVHTLTEHGILGKLGVSSRGVGLHFNILGHATDGGPMRLPVHVLARQVLDGARDVPHAMKLAGAAVVSASTVLTLLGEGAAVCAELAPAGPRFAFPDRDGRLVHANHFLDPHLAAGDRAPREMADSFLRQDGLERALAAESPADLPALEALASRVAAVCCRPEPDAAFGERWATLATASIDVTAAALHVRAGAPCDDTPWHTATSEGALR